MSNTDNNLIWSLKQFADKKPIDAKKWNEYAKDQPKKHDSECAVCGQIYKNWAGSTPCCGSVAFIVESKNTPSV